MAVAAKADPTTIPVASTQPAPQSKSTESSWSARMVSKFCPSRETAMGWANTAAHIGAYLAEGLTHLVVYASLGFIALKSIILFPPSAMLVLPAAITIGLFSFNGICNAFDGIHTAIDKTIR